MLQQYQMLRAVSRTFALSIEQLPAGPRDALTLAYLLLRVSDGIEDHPELSAERKNKLLHLWERVLAGEDRAGSLYEAIADLDPANPEIAVALQSQELLDQLGRLPREVQEHVLRYVRQTTLGMARWQIQGPVVRTEEELDDYMHQVAGLVGYLITEVFADYYPSVRRRRDALLPLAREFGLALQTVNVIRGIASDRQRGWVFVPQSFCEQAGISQAQLFDPAHQDRALEVVEMLVRKAERHLAHGLDYVRLLPRRLHRLRLMCIWPLLFAVRTLAVSRANPAVLRSEAKIGRTEVRAIMRNTALLGWSNRWLAWYYHRLGRTPGQAAQSGTQTKSPSIRRSKGGESPSGRDEAQAVQRAQTPSTSTRYSRT